MQKTKSLCQVIRMIGPINLNLSQNASGYSRIHCFILCGPHFVFILIPTKMIQSAILWKPKIAYLDHSHRAQNVWKQLGQTGQLYENQS